MPHKIVNGVQVELEGAELQAFLDKEVLHSSSEAQLIRIQMERAAAYPPIGDQLDALMKQFNLMKLNGVGLTAELDSILGQWLAVKTQFPKPGE